MPKVNILIKGITIKGNRWGMDSVVIDPPVKMHSNTNMDFPEGATITLKSVHSYMGVTTLNEIIVAEVKSDVPVIRISTPSGSMIEGELVVKEKMGNFKIETISRNIETLNSNRVERRIIK